MSSDERRAGRKKRRTPPGSHLPVLLGEVLEVLNPKPGGVVVDCTVGAAGHALALLRRIGPTGLLIGVDLDGTHLSDAKAKLASVGFPFHLHHANFAGLETVLAQHCLSGVDTLVADLGMSSMQLDDPVRGFAYMRVGPLDMRMDPTRGRSAAELLQSLSRDEIESSLSELGDEFDADRIADAIVAHRAREPISTTRDLSRIVLEVTVGRKGGKLKPDRWNSRPVARVFQSLRLLVNRELANLENLLRRLPTLLRPGGRAAIISFHSGEDRLVKAALTQGLRSGQFTRISEEPIVPSLQEARNNPRSRSAKLRWAERAS